MFGHIHIPLKESSSMLNNKTNFSEVGFSLTENVNVFPFTLRTHVLLQMAVTILARIFWQFWPELQKVI